MLTPYVILGDLDVNAVESDTGVTWVAKPVEGWAGPASNIAVAKKPRSHGAWVSDPTLEARHMNLPGTVIAPSEAALTDALDRLNQAATITATTLTVVEGGVSRWATVHREGAVLTKRISPLAVEWAVGLVAPDPRKFGDEISASTGLPSSTGGVTFPLAFPVTFDAVTESGQVSLTNNGNIAGPVRLRIDGPVTGPVVTHVGTGRSLVFSTSLVLGEGEFITVDAERREVLAQGQSSRNGWVTGRGWPLFVPGVNTYSFSAMSHSPGALLTVTGSPAWE